LVEALTIGVGVLIVWTLGPTWEALRVLLLGLGLIAVTFTDLEHLLIPDRITLPGIAVGFLSQLYPAPRALIGAIAGALLAGAIFYGIALVSRGGMGGGDVKLAAMIGAFVGWQRVLVAIFLAVVAGGIVGLALLLTGRKRRKDPLPFGPFLALGGLRRARWGPAPRHPPPGDGPPPGRHDTLRIDHRGPADGEPPSPRDVAHGRADRGGEPAQLRHAPPGGDQPVGALRPRLQPAHGRYRRVQEVQ